MVYVRVHVLKNYLSAEQKRELGDRLVAAIAEVENLRNTERHQQTSWVQYFELDRENWYGPVSIGDANALWEVDVIAPQELLPTEKEARMAIKEVTQAIRSLTGEGLLPARGPWVHVYTIPPGHWGMDGSIPNWEAARAYFAAATAEEAARVLETVMGRLADPAETDQFRKERRKTR
jgi:phenylpyruvate tautomerase PptA (4-oxalocrotonate tautomerase family)